MLQVRRPRKMWPTKWRADPPRKCGTGETWISQVRGLGHCRKRVCPYDRIFSTVALCCPEIRTCLLGGWVWVDRTCLTKLDQTRSSPQATFVGNLGRINTEIHCELLCIIQTLFSQYLFHRTLGYSALFTIKPTLSASSEVASVFRHESDMYLPRSFSCP